jgi:pyruvate dehydrogenase E2 component (dihydrolipoamide acetyltransferase)
MATDVLVPPLGQTVDTVTLVAWYKREGETVKQGEPLFAVETDKATLDVEAPATGTLQQVTARPGEPVQVLSAIARIAGADEVPESAPAPSRPRPAGHDAPSSPEQPAGQARGGASRAGRIFISPRARRLAEARAVPLEALQPTGPEGAIIERDVRAYLDRQAAPGQPAPAITPVARRMAEEAGLEWRGMAGTGPAGRITRDDVAGALAAADETAGPTGAVHPIDSQNEAAEVIPMRGVRAVIAGRMLHSATHTAAVTLTAEADVTRLVELRGEFERDGLSVSYSDLFLYILAHALREHPQLNASLDAGAVKLWRRIHIGLAVDTGRGLLVPVVRDVDQKGLLRLARETRELVERARAGRCAPDELTGGTFTLTNLGMFGIDVFTPIINSPECAILGVGRIKIQPALADGQWVPRHMAWLSLTFDHRLVDGAPAARFLQRVVQLSERPHWLIA